MARNNFTACYGCTERSEGCHGRCERYKAEKDAWDAERAKIGKEKDKAVMMMVYTQGRKDHIRRSGTPRKRTR